VTQPDIAIVGGGLLGRCLAWRASKAGARVALYDAASSRGEGSAAWVAAGMITPSAEAVDADPEIVAMGRRSLSLWPQWLAELPESVFYRDDGTLLLWHREDAGEAHRFERLLATRDAQAHLVHVDAARLSELEPALDSRFQQSLYLSGEAQIDNRALLKTLTLALEELGPLAAFASDEGYSVKPNSHVPFHGYYFHMLNRQGDHALGGAKDYMVNGKMVGGFAFVAYPAEYGNSGIMTFIINEDGVLLQKDLGKTTIDSAAAMSEFDPDATWSPVVE
jgi:Protein of unknown function (DUF2950)/FAD dependent oxidoreductase